MAFRNDQHDDPSLPPIARRPRHDYPIANPGAGEPVVFPGDPGTTVPDPSVPPPTRPRRSPYEPDPRADLPPWVNSAVDALCACLLKQLPDAIAAAVEQRLVTSRGPQVRAPSTCAQPVGAKDVDDQVFKFNLPSTDTVGQKRTVLKRTVTRATVLKGINWGFSVPSSTKNPADPADQIAVTILVNGNPVSGAPQATEAPTDGHRTAGAYVSQRVPPAPGGITALGAAQIYLLEGDTVELIAERLQEPGGTTRQSYFLAARWKGWEWDATVHASGATGAAGF